MTVTELPASERRRVRMADHIERAAMELFLERGYDAVTIDEIAEAADISARTFFRYFRAKEELLLRDLRRRIDDFERSLAARPTEEAPVDAVRAAFRAQSETFQRERGAVLRWAKVVAGTSALLPSVSSTQSSFHTPLADFLAERLGRDPQDLQPRIMASALLGASWAAYEHWLEGGGNLDLVELTERALDLLRSPTTWGESWERPR